MNERKTAWRHRAWLRAGLGVVLALGLGACAVAPTPISTDERAVQVTEDRKQLFADQEPLSGPVSLSEAMARAIKYNINQRLRAMEQALSQRQIDVARYDLLPQLDLEAAYRGRNNQNASSSRSIITQRQSLEPSRSQDRDRKTGQLELVWNVLDFGISYYSARQQANRALIAAQKRRKVVHDLLQDVREAYWKAVSAQQLAGKIETVRRDAEQALADARQVEKERLQPLLQTLRYQKALLDVIQKLESLEQDLAQAKPRLAALMNIPFGEPFVLEVPSADALTLPRVPLELAQMEEIALTQRPELLEAAYEGRISALETRKAMARLLPGLELSFGGQFDSNSFLANQSWYETGLRLTWNLLSIPGRLKGLELAEVQEGVVNTQRLALSMAILSQVHLSYREFNNVTRRFERAQQLLDVEQRILDNVAATAGEHAVSPLEAIRTASSTMLAELRRYDSYAAVQAASGRVHATLGLDPLPDFVPSHSVKDLAATLDEVLQRWNAGELPVAKRILAAPELAAR